MIQSFADTTSRFVAYVIDSVIVSIIGSIIAGILGLGRGTVVTSSGSPAANYTVTGGAFLVPYVVVGFAYFVVLAFTRALGQSHALPPALAAWSANGLFGLIGSYLILGEE